MNKSESRVVDFLLSNFFKIMAVIVATTTVLLIFTFSFDIARSEDLAPDFAALTRNEQKELGPFYAKVKAGLYIKNFSKFDVINNFFEMDAVVWFEFDPSEVTLDNVGRFTFLDGEIKRKAEPDVKMIGKNVFAKYNVKVELKSDFRFDYYPYEYHKLPIVITNDYLSTSGMVFITSDSNFTLNEKLTISNWNIDDFTTNYGFRRASFDRVDESKSINYPVALFLIDFSAKGIKNALVIFLPIFFSLLLGLFALMVPLTYGEPNFRGIGFATASVTSLLGYRFVIQSMTPSVAYITTTDSVYTLALVTGFVSFILLIIGTYLASARHVTKDMSKKDVVFGHNATRILNLVFTLMFIILFLISIIFLYRILLL